MANYLLFYKYFVVREQQTDAVDLQLILASTFQLNGTRIYTSDIFHWCILCIFSNIQNLTNCRKSILLQI